MRVLAVSDLHGKLPYIPKCDVLLIGGDICPDYDAIDSSMNNLNQARWLNREFRQWLDDIPATRVVSIAGNHDFVFQDQSFIPDGLRWTYLQDETVEVMGLKIHGTPWVPNLAGWAFYGGEQGVDFGIVQNIPSDLDVLLSHGPPRGYGDRVGPRYGDIDVGCETMADALSWIRPKAFVCGHIHEGRGHYRHADVELGVFNVAYVDENYTVQRERGPVDIEL